MVLMKRQSKRPQRLYTIEEWKAKFGQPGGGVTHDQHGRAYGIGSAYFPTEPDFCEPHPDDDPLPPAA
jgi:hypothetical protein